MLDTFKVLFILTGASTYLVTKYIRVGVDDKNDTSPYFDHDTINTGSSTDGSVEQDLRHPITTTISSKEDEYKKSSTENKIIDEKSSGAKNSSKHNLPSPSFDTSIFKNHKYRVISSENNGNYTRAVFHISDVQDNPSAAGRPTFEIEIIEEDDRNLPKRLLQVTVSDEKHESDKVYYTLTGQGVDLKKPSRSKFGINTTSGEIYALRALDRDSPLGRAQWKLAVFAEDERTRGLVGYADVIVNLKDINDNSPFFAFTHYSANVTENGTVGLFVTQLSAIDVDDPNEGSNAKITYIIEDNQVNDNGQLIFVIDPQTGTINTDVCCLDRESHSQYTIKVVASDGDGLKASATVTINVVDINDMPPKFIKHDWYVEIDEMDTRNNSDEPPVPQMPILIVTVTDGDLFESNKFVFKIINDNINSDYFTLTTNTDASASLRVTKPLDYENDIQRNINLTIAVCDNGANFSDPYHTDYGVIHVRLRDINDNEPQFMKSSIEVSVPEDTTIGSIIAKFHAIDADQNGLSRVSYRILRESDKRRQFSIDSNGVVRLERRLDRETVPKHIILIIASDDGNPSKSSTAILTINVEDVNDNAPQLLNDYLPVIMENSPPQKIGEIFATDKDEKVKGNGPPFTFRLDANAPEVIRNSFKVQHDHSGEGKAIVYSRTSFDRELEKQYLLPIVIKDSGYPSLSSTNTLTVIVGDINDNTMSDGWKRITIFYVKSSEVRSDVLSEPQKLTEIGTINVDDDDDWDTSDKLYFWYKEVVSDPNFDLDTKTGMIRMRNVTKGDYDLRFTVFDTTHKQEVHSNVWINVIEIDYQTVFSSGSLKISAISSFDFITTWDWRAKKQMKSYYERLKDSLKRIIRCDEIEIFSVIENSEGISVRYYAKRQSTVMSSVFLNANVEQNRIILESELQLNITQIGINECMQEEAHECEGKSCVTDLVLDQTNSVLVNANYTSFVGIDLVSKPKCVCKYDQRINTNRIELCSGYGYSDKCVNSGNGGACDSPNKPLKSTNMKCDCYDRSDRVLPQSPHSPQALQSPHCQLSTRSFNGHGWVWLPPLVQCSDTHISLEIMTQIPDGLILYFGPIIHTPYHALQQITDFISLELRDGFARMLFDFGSGTVELTVVSRSALNNGEWHTIDMFYDKQSVRLMIDHCVDAVIYDTEPVKMDRSRCENVSSIPQFSELLNVNSPVLQIGGISHHSIAKQYKWKYSHTTQGFTGCIRNLIHNAFIYDLNNIANSANSVHGCPAGDSMCNFLSKSCTNGECLGTYNSAKCVCKAGWFGPQCDNPTQPKMFQQRSFVKYALAIDLDPFSADIQLQFRTRQPHGELIRLSSKDKREYNILEIRDSKIRFRFNLNHMRSIAEKELTLHYVHVNDGVWHTVRVLRFGSAVSLTLDGGGVTRFTENIQYMNEHQLLVVDKSNIVIGGDVHYLGIGASVVANDFADGCINDIRIDGQYVGMENDSENVAVTEWRNVIDGCLSNNPCESNTCQQPFVCVDVWLMHKCSCPLGYKLTSDQTNCTKHSNPCGDDLCDGMCGSTDPSFQYQCQCPTNLCNSLSQTKYGLTTTAMAAIILCAINIPLLLIIICVYSRYIGKRRSRKKRTNEANDDDVRENIVTYADEGGEDDIKAYDMTSLRIQITANSVRKTDNSVVAQTASQFAALPHNNLADIIRDHLDKSEVDIESPPVDELHKFASEGSGNTVGSLSSISDNKSPQDFNLIELHSKTNLNNNIKPILTKRTQNELSF